MADMRLMVAAGFGELIGEVWLGHAAKIAHGIRQEIPNGVHAQPVNKLVEELSHSGTAAVLHVAGWLWGDVDGTNIHKDEHRKPSPEATYGIAAQTLWAVRQYGLEHAYLESGPELNIDPVFKKDLGLLEEHCWAAWEAIQKSDRKVPLIAASVSNLTRKGGMRSLEKWVARCPKDWWIGIHPYRTRGPLEKQPELFEGFGSSGQMLTTLKDVLDGRKFALTEAGWHNGEQKYKGGPLNLCTRVSQYGQAEVATWARWDIGFWREAGAELYTWYQIRDGEPDAPHHDAHFGAYYADGTPKLVAHTLQQEKAA